MQDNQPMAKLRWQCRRGMLELDLLLQPFLEKIYPQLSVEEKALFVDLLQQQDQDLYEWLIKQQQPPNKNLLGIIERVRRGS